LRVTSAGPAPFQVPLPGSKLAATANATTPLLDRGHHDVAKRDRFPRPSNCETDAWRRIGRLQKDLLTLGAASVQMAPDASKIVWMIKSHPTENRMPRQAKLAASHT
jgi:hypothetical protein